MLRVDVARVTERAERVESRAQAEVGSLRAELAAAVLRAEEDARTLASQARSLPRPPQAGAARSGRALL